MYCYGKDTTKIKQWVGFAFWIITIGLYCASLVINIMNGFEHALTPNYFSFRDESEYNGEELLILFAFLSAITMIVSIILTFISVGLDADSKVTYGYTGNKIVNVERYGGGYRVSSRNEETLLSGTPFAKYILICICVGGILSIISSMWTPIIGIVVSIVGLIINICFVMDVF